MEQTPRPEIQVYIVEIRNPALLLRQGRSITGEMSLHRTRDQFQRAGWKAAFLLPAWTLQLILALTILALFSWRIAITMSPSKDSKDTEETIKVEYAYVKYHGAK